MRIVAGSARGRRLESPSGSDVRPTTDRVREATFNALGSLGALDGAAVLDLFAGSGALGLEALSRGAQRATFVESSARALRTVRANVVACGFEDRSEIVAGDALDHLRRVTRSQRWDLALCDPPYAFERWEELFSLLGASVLVVESDRDIEVPAPWRVVRRRTYGTTVVTIADDRPAPRAEEMP